MEKYNLRKIMQRAWELVRTTGTTISSGLKKAWEEAKRKEKSYTVKEWFANKIANEIGRSILMCDVLLS